MIRIDFLKNMSNEKKQYMLMNDVVKLNISKLAIKKMIKNYIDNKPISSTDIIALFFKNILIVYKESDDKIFFYYKKDYFNIIKQEFEIDIAKSLIELDKDLELNIIQSINWTIVAKIVKKNQNLLSIVNRKDRDLCFLIYFKDFEHYIDQALSNNTFKDITDYLTHLKYNINQLKKYESNFYEEQIRLDYYIKNIVYQRFFLKEFRLLEYKILAKNKEINYANSDRINFYLKFNKENKAISFVVWKNKG